ncbi:MAG: helix-turn-helix domain-containing protein [Candidatus Heimdallarchaeota archaeon]|nr:helix-turn-helix domain-containing protein [Candidatus Heimdallarchaeota archaeon]
MDFRESNSSITPDSVSSDFPVDLTVDDRDSTILELYSQGYSTYQIATKLTINRHTVSKVLRDNDIKTRRTKDYFKPAHDEIVNLFTRKGLSKHDIAKKMDCTYYTVRKVLEDRGVIFNKKDRETLAIAKYIQMKNQGLMNIDIANFLEMTTKQLNRLVRNSGFNIQAIRLRTKKFTNLIDIIKLRLEGFTLTEISIKFRMNIVEIKDILYHFGLSKNKR